MQFYTNWYVQKWPNRKRKLSARERLILKVIKMHSAMIWFSLFDFSELACRSPQIALLSVHTPLIRGTGNNSACSQEMGCQERGTGGPEKKKWNESYLFRKTAAGCSLQQIWSDNSIVQRLSMGSMPEHVHHSCENENTDYVKSESGPFQIKYLAMLPHIFTYAAI